jgi:hypothetical protein
MTSAAMRPTGNRGGVATTGRGYGLVIFASALLMIAGAWNVIQGSAAIAHSHVFPTSVQFVFGDLRAWGWVTLVFGVVQIVAGVGVLVGNQAARWFAVAVAALNAIVQMFFIPAYPFWSLAVIAMDVVALYGLCLYGSRENVEAANIYEGDSTS